MVFVDLDHMHDQATRKLVTGMIWFICLMDPGVLFQ
jgi:hypothetical protein